MKFSMIFEAQILDTSRKREFEIMHECVEQAVLGEEVGFDGVWAVEHHSLKWYAHMSAPETFLAYVAGKTSREDQKSLDPNVRPEASDNQEISLEKNNLTVLCPNNTRIVFFVFSPIH